MCVNSLPKIVTRQRHDCDLNPGHSAPESSTLTTRLPSQPKYYSKKVKFSHTRYRALGPELIPVYRQSARR